VLVLVLVLVAVRAVLRHTRLLHHQHQNQG